MTQLEDGFLTPIAHIGFHKTASTMIQSRILTPEHGFYAPWPIAFHLEKIIEANPYANQIKQLKATYRPYLEKASDTGLSLAISHEALLGEPFDEGNRYATTRYVEPLLTAIPQLIAIVTIREQVDMLASLYKWSISATKTWNLDSFLGDKNSGVRAFGLEFLEYSWPIIELQRIFGLERVRVVPYEWLATDPSRFTSSFETFSGRSIRADVVMQEVVHKGLDSIEAEVKRISNRILPNSQQSRIWLDSRFRSVAKAVSKSRGSGAGAAADRRLKLRIAAFIGDRYAESNTELQRITGVNLSELGYQLKFN